MKSTCIKDHVRRMASPLPPLYPRLTLTVPRRSFPGCSPNSLFRFIQSTTAHIENLGGNYYLRLSKPSATNNNEFYEKIRHFIFCQPFVLYCHSRPFLYIFIFPLTSLAIVSFSGLFSISGFHVYCMLHSLVGVVGSGLAFFCIFMHVVFFPFSPFPFLWQFQSCIVHI